MKNSFVLIIIILITNLNNAQITQNIRGTVIDKDSKTPLIGVNITLPDAEQMMGSSSDINGNYLISNIAVGRHTVKFSYVGYEAIVLQNIELSSGKELILNIELIESLFLDEVIIEAKNEKKEAINKMATVSARTFSIEETMRYAGSLNDVSRMAQNFAGVQGSDDSRNDIVIRGNSPTGVLYRLEGVDIPNPNHFALMGTTGGPVSMLNNNLLDNSDFITGAFPAEYGNSLAGVFDLHLRSGNNQHHEFLGQIGFNGVEFLAEGPISKDKFSSYIVNGRYSTLKLFQLIGLDVGTGSATPEYQDVSFKLKFPNNKGNTVFWGIGGTSNVAFLESENEIGSNMFSEGGEDLIFESAIGILAMTNTYRFNDKSYLNTTLSIDATSNKIINDTLDLNKERYFAFYRNSSLEGKQSLNVIYNNKINSRHLIKIGSYNQRKFINLNDSVHIKQDSILLPTIGYIDIDQHWRQVTDYKGATYFVQPFMSWQFRINEDIILNSGIHSQYFIYNNTYAIEPRAGLKWNINKLNNIAFAYGMHHQLAPTRLFFKQLDDDFGNLILDDNGDAYIANKNLKMTRSQHFILSYNKSLSANTRLKSEIYYQYLDKVPVCESFGEYSILNFGANFDLVFPDTLINKGSGKNYGLEITLEHFLHKGFYYLFTASLYESKYKGYDEIERNTAFSGNYTSNLLLGKEFRFLKNKEKKQSESSLVTDIKFTLNGGQRYVPIDLDESRVSGRAVYDYSQAYVNKLPDYYRIDFKIGFKMNHKNKTEEWTIFLQNVTNHKNIFYKSYDAINGVEKTYYQNGLLPVIQYKILF